MSHNASGPPAARPWPFRTARYAAKVCSPGFVSWHHVRHDLQPKGPCRVTARARSGPPLRSGPDPRVPPPLSTDCRRQRVPRSLALSAPGTTCGQGMSAMQSACGRTTFAVPPASCGITTSTGMCTTSAVAVRWRPATCSTSWSQQCHPAARATFARSSVDLMPSWNSDRPRAHAIRLLQAFGRSSDRPLALPGLRAGRIGQRDMRQNSVFGVGFRDYDGLVLDGS
ncbi:MAG: hypothetical protein JWN03_8083 [Nocardia sp.]|nr:hypothetical protein [Nocardia sp.]